MKLNRVALVFFLTIFGILGSASVAGAQFVFERQFGQDTLVKPRAIDTDADGNVYVSSDTARTITSFDPGGEKIDQWGGIGNGDGLFNQIGGIAVDKTDRLLYASDGEPSHRIQKFGLNGQFFQKWGQLGVGEDQMNRPLGLDVDQDGFVHVADFFNHRVKAFSDIGTFFFQFGSLGFDDSQFDGPTGVAVGTGGNVLVGDRSGTIREFSGGSFVRRFGGQDPTDVDGLDDGKFGFISGASALDVDHLGRIWAVDSDYDRIQVFNPDGTFLTKFGVLGAGQGQFDHPSDIAVDPDGSIYVADRDNNRVQVFRNEVLFPIDGPGPGPGPGPTAKSNKFTFGKQLRNRKKGLTTLRVKVPGPGNLTLLNSKSNRKSAVKVKRASTVGLKIRAKGKARRTLLRKGRVSIRVKVRYVPVGGSARTKSTKVRLLLKR